MLVVKWHCEIRSVASVCYYFPGCVIVLALCSSTTCHHCPPALSATNPFLAYAIHAAAVCLKHCQLKLYVETFSANTFKKCFLIREERGVLIREERGVLIREERGVPIREERGVLIREERGVLIREERGVPIREERGERCPD